MVFFSRAGANRASCLGYIALLVASGGGCASSPNGSSNPLSSDPSHTSAPPTDASYISTRLTLSVPKVVPSSLHIQSVVGGQTTAESLLSLKYYIRSIQICEDVQTQGTATNNAVGCLEIYKGAEDAYPYSPSDQDFTPLANKARTTDEGFIDLMDDTSRAKLTTNTPLTSDNVHAYNYGLVGWALPIKVKASVAMNDGSTFYTHDGATVRTVFGQNNSASYPTVTTTALTEGPAEEAVVLHPNGGTWFKFQSPLTITQADIDSKASYVLDLAFNPDGLVKGYTFGGPPSSITEAGDAPRTISIPMLGLTPVPHRATETVVKETYLATIAEGADNFDLRLELYSIKEDSARTVYGADTETLINEHTNTSISDFAKVSFMQSNTDGTLDFQIWDRSPSISGFMRKANEGDTTTATVHCAGPNTGATNGAFGVFFEGCTNGEVPVTFALTKVTEL